MLQRRIELLEKKNRNSDKHAALAETNERLEQLVSQLQHALEETMNDLERVGKQFSELESSAGVDPARLWRLTTNSPCIDGPALSDDGPQAKAAGEEDKPDAAEAAQDKPPEAVVATLSPSLSWLELPPASLGSNAKRSSARAEPGRDSPSGAYGAARSNCSGLGSKRCSEPMTSTKVVHRQRFGVSRRGERCGT